MKKKVEYIWGTFSNPSWDTRNLQWEWLEETSNMWGRFPVFWDGCLRGQLFTTFSPGRILARWTTALVRVYVWNLPPKKDPVLKVWSSACGAILGYGGSFGRSSLARGSGASWWLYLVLSPSLSASYPPCHVFPSPSCSVSSPKKMIWNLWSMGQ